MWWMVGLCPGCMAVDYDESLRTFPVSEKKEKELWIMSMAIMMACFCFRRGKSYYVGMQRAILLMIAFVRASFMAQNIHSSNH